SVDRLPACTSPSQRIRRSEDPSGRRLRGDAGPGRRRRSGLRESDETDRPVLSTGRRDPRQEGERMEDGVRPARRLAPGCAVAEAKKYLADGQFPPGSMGPKVEAVVEFLEHGGQHAVITDLEHLVPAVAGKAGTQLART